MFISKLTFSNFRTRKIRAALTIAAIALSVSLVVAVTGSYASAHAAAQKMLSQFMGTTDAQITRHNANIDTSLIDQIAKDPQVRRVDGRLEMTGRLLNDKGAAVLESVQVVGLDRPSDTRVETLNMEAGYWFNSADGDDAVIDEVAQEKLNIQVGGTFILPGLDKQQTLHVVGVVHKPMILATASQTIYVPLHTLQQLMLPKNPNQVSRVMIDLKEGSDQDAFVARWKDKLAAVDPNLKIKLASENRKDLDRNLQGLHILSYMGGTVSMAAAMFIVFSALSMGVSERQRTLAMLRAIGAVKSQLGKLVVCEGLALAMLGVVVGIPLGYLWTCVLTWIFPKVFTAGAVISYGGIVFAAGGSIFTALAASLLPAFSAMRVSPLEAMTPLAKPSRMRGIFISAIVGLILVALDPLLLFLPFNKNMQFYGHFSIGVCGVMIGFFLLAPLLVWIIEWTIGPIISILFGLRFSLLRQQLSGGLWRAAGTGAALMVGLAILIVTQTQGVSAVSGWKLPDKFPDIFIFSGAGLTFDEQAKLAQVKGIRPGEIMPIAITSPEFGSSVFAIAGATFIPDATMFFGIDPNIALDMMQLNFYEGTPEQAKQLLKLGRHVIVTQEFKQVRGIKLGDAIPLKTNKGMVDFIVAGIVWSPGIDVIASSQDLGTQLETRTAASMFGSLDDAREYFGVERVHLFAANLDLGVEKQQVLWQVQQALAAKGLRAGDVRQIKYSIQKTLLRLLLMVSTVAYAAMAVASLGVTNTIMASIRSRRWHFGILRSIGVTRTQLLRLVLAEALLLGFVGVALGMAAGFEMAIDARQEWNLFLGYVPPIVVPWGTVTIGVVVVMSVAILASLWPAIHVAKAEPLALLQAGRASA